LPAPHCPPRIRPAHLPRLAGAAPRARRKQPERTTMQTEPQLKRPDLFRSATLIGGEWVKDSSAGEPIAVVDPATGRLLGTVPNAGRAETARAIEAADAAFPAWREKTAAERADHLRRLAQLITDNKEDLARILTAEQGKPLAEARGE